VKKVSVLLFLLGCSGSGATVSDSSADISEGRPPPVEAQKPAEPVDPGTSFECKTSRPLSDGSLHTIRFALQGDALDSAIGIEVEPQASVLAPLTKATLERKEGKLVLTTTERAELTLFENSDLTRGYVKVGTEYSDVFCTKR
jgi:hypothetical protein